MKKSIKRLSAILAILVLSMTLAVPVTAVEFGVSSTYGLDAVIILHEETHFLYDSDGDFVLIAGSHCGYIENTNTFVADTNACMPNETNPDHAFAAETLVYLDCRNNFDDDDMFVSDPMSTGWDISDAYISFAVPENAIDVEVSHHVTWGSEDLLDQPELFVIGSDF